MSISAKYTPGQGLVQFNGEDGGVDFGGAPVSGSFVGAFSGSHTVVGDGSPFLVAGANVVITTGSNGSITVAAPAVPASPVGLDKQVQFNDSGSLAGDPGLTYDRYDGLLTATKVGTTSITAASVIVSGTTGGPGGGYLQMLPVDAAGSIPANLTASYVYTSGSTNDLYFTQYQGPYTNTTRLRWLESYMSTGILHGGVVSTTPGTTTFSVAAGEGIVVAQNASTSSSPYPTIKLVKWDNFVNVPLAYSASAKITYIGIGPDGDLIQQTLPWGSININQHDEAIDLAAVLHLSGNLTTGVFNAPQVSYASNQQTDDFLRAFGPMKLSGHTLEASGSTLGIVKAAGRSFKLGANYTVDPSHPSTIVEDTPVTVSKIARYYVSGSTPIIDVGPGAAGYTYIDPTHYNNNGTLTLVPSGSWTIQRVFWVPNSPTGLFLVYYGNTAYADASSAQGGINNEPFIEAPNSAQNAILLGYIILREDCTDLSDGLVIIQQAGLFRQVGGVGVSAQPTVPTQLQELGDVSISAGSTGDMLVFNQTTGFWSNSKTLQSFTVGTANTTTTNATTVNASYLTGSLTKLSDGSSYLVAGGNMSVVTGSNGSVTLATVNSGTIHGVTAGTGLTGGGTSGVIVVNLSNTGSAGTYGSASQVPVFVTDPQGRVTAVSNTSIQITESQVTGLVTDLGNITGSINSLSSSLASQKADKITTISAGTGLAGGGDLSANRTISMPNVGTAGTYGSAALVPVFTTDAQGRVTAVTNTSASLDASQVTSGILSVARGGTGLSSSGLSGSILTSNGTGWASSVLTINSATAVNNSATASISVADPTHSHPVSSTTAVNNSATASISVTDPTHSHPISSTTATVQPLTLAAHESFNIAQNIGTTLATITLPGSTPVSPSAQPGVPRNIQVNFGNNWNGGNITVAGTDVFGNVVSETFTSNPGNLAVGTKIFSLINANGITHTLNGTGGAGHNATVQLDSYIGVLNIPVASFLKTSVAGLNDSFSSTNLSSGSFGTTTSINGNVVDVWYTYQVTPVQNSHTHVITSGSTGITATDAGHNHTQNSHTHVLTSGSTGITASDAGHNHTQASHTHTHS